MNPSTPEAVILAGGFGTRLRSSVPDLPKSMAPVAGRPFVEYLLQTLEQQAVDEVILSVGYRKEAIMRHFGRHFGRIRIRYSVEETPLGTGGGIRQALALAETSPVLVLNGDTYVGFRFQEMLSVLSGNQPAGLVLTVVKLESADRSGTIEIEGGRVQRFNHAGGQGPALVNGGVYLMPRDLFVRYPIDKPAFSFEKDFLEAHLDEVPVWPYFSGGPFIDIGAPASYAEAQIVMPQWTARP